MLVVTDEVAALVGGQGGLAGTGQAEEQGDITLLAHVGRAVHRQHVLLREQEVLHGEHGLLHLARIAHAGDQHLACREIDDDGTVGIGAVTLGLANELGRVDDLPGRLGLGIVFGRIDEQATAEQVVPGRLGTHDDGQVVLDISTYMNVGDELITLVQVALTRSHSGANFSSGKGRLIGPQ